jgi:hypothetical protein
MPTAIQSANLAARLLLAGVLLDVVRPVILPAAASLGNLVFFGVLTALVWWGSSRQGGVTAMA